MIRKNRKKILVALSGGVDSAVAAAQLLKQGHQVVGVFFRFFDPTWKSDFQVKRIAKKLGIPLKIIDARKDFKKKIIGYFIESYRKGITPNPCVVCNKEMKFRLLFDLIRKEKADYVATGHYARIIKQSSAFPSASAAESSKPSFFYKLLEAKDKTKDQSYFLYRLSQKYLAKIIFPLGDYRKSDVKKMAKKIKLPVAENESQDICFLERNDLNTYLNKYLKPSRGNIVDALGNIIGLHRGLPFYTIGQRKGIEIGPPRPTAAGRVEAGGTGPYWVLEKNIRKNNLIVTSDPKRLLTKKFRIRQANWINKPTKWPLRTQVRIRYRAKKFPAIIKPAGRGMFSVKSKRPLRAVTSGQSAVFYKRDQIIGGGIILNR